MKPESASEETTWSEWKFAGGHLYRSRARYAIGGSGTATEYIFTLDIAAAHLNALEARVREAEAKAVLADEFHRFDAFVLSLGSEVWTLKEFEHRVKCPNRETFAFRDCPYFSCKMTRESVEAVRTEWHEGPVARYDALKASANGEAANDG